MKTGKYGLKEFEDSDDADLVQYSKEMNEAIEKALDKNKGEKGDKGDKGDKGEKGDGIVPILVDIVYGKYLNINSAKYSKNRLEISGDLEQEKRSGKNKCPNTLVSGTSNGITYTVNTNGSIKLSGTSTAQTELKLYYNSTKPIIFKAGKYKNTSNLLIVLHGSTYYGINANSTITFSEDVSIYDIYFRINNGVTINETYYPQIINTSITTDETYEQYGATPSTEFPSMPVVCTGVQMIRQSGKNFIPYPYANSTMTARGINYVSNSDGSISISGTSNSNIADFYLFGNTTDNGNYLHLKQDTYFLKDTENANIIYIAREKTLGVLVGINTILQALKTQDCYFYGFFIRVNNGATVNTVIYPQLSLGNTDTEYEPYWEQIHTLNLGTTQLCAIKENGDVVAKDRPVYRNGKWQWEKNIGKYTFTGVDTDGYDFNSDNTDTLAVNLIINKKYEVVKKFNNVLSMCCDKFNFINNVNDIEHIYITSATTIENGYKGNIRLYINKDRLSGYNSSLTNTQKANLVKTWLQSNPITVYCILVTPEYIDCTTKQSTVLDKIYNNFELQKGVNNIIIESENGVGINMELTYLTDNEMNNTFATKKELHEHENKEILDNIEEPYTTVEMTKLKGIEEGATALKTYFVPVNIDTTTGWYKALDGTLTDYNNRNIILLITQLYSGASGILKINVRSNNRTLSNAGFYWLANTGLSNSNFALNITGNKFTLYVQTTSNYHKYEIRVLENELLSKKEATINFYAPLASDKATLQSDGNNYPSVQAYASNDSVGLKINGFNGRIADINLNKDTSEYGRKRTDIVTNSVTNKNGIGDGFLETYYWDNAGKYDIQYFLPNSDAGRPAIRINSEKGWKEWKFLPFLDDIIALKKDLLKRTHEFAFTDFGSGTVYYNLLGLYTDNLTKKEVGYTTGVNVTYKQVQDIQGQINTGITGETIYMSVRLTYIDLGTIEITQDKYGNLYNIYMENSSGGLACFTGDTKILTGEGLKELKDIKIKDRILTTKGYKQVIKKYEHITHKIYNIVINGKLVQCSYSHPFITNRGTIMAKDLLKGDIVYNINKEKLEITNITVEEKETKVFEINTDIDNYYITDKNILVSSENLL